MHTCTVLLSMFILSSNLSNADNVKHLNNNVTPSIENKIEQLEQPPLEQPEQLTPKLCLDAPPQAKVQVGHLKNFYPGLESGIGCLNGDQSMRRISNDVTSEAGLSVQGGVANQPIPSQRLSISDRHSKN